MPARRTLPLLIIPAAGVGSRLGLGMPKFLATVGGRAMLEWLLALYTPHVARAALVVAPAFDGAARALVSRITTLPVDIFHQPRPTGMLDAVLLPRAAVEGSAADRVWVTWCDQLAIDRRTIEQLGSERSRCAALAMPTVWRRMPYIHFERDAAGRICGVRQRREGDSMPHIGESDAGLFSLSRFAYLEALSEYSSTIAAGTTTGERNLLPFIPWLATRANVVTFDCVHDSEAIGINTPDELRQVEAFLLGREHW